MTGTWDGLVGALAGAPSLPGARCRGRAHLFDEARPDEAEEIVQGRHAQALALCAGCPSLDRCEDWFTSLPPRKRPGGVIAGRIHQWSTTTRKKGATA